ncbi:glyceraldehyde-3-phosphate dehydrogenase [bacterium]|nr:MAG: glyceraldehyde-3-phosphate dehydrogenase [bacterium]
MNTTVRLAALLYACLTLVMLVMLAPLSADGQVRSSDSAPVGIVDADTDSARVQTRHDLFFDPDDGQLDLSGFLTTRSGFLPVASIITEPAVGYGGALGLMFLHDSIENRAQQVRDKSPDGTLTRLPPPSMTGVGAFATESGSWGGALFHNGIYLDDRLRYLGVAVYSELDLDFFGRGGDFDLPIESVAYSLDGFIFVQQLLTRVADSDVFMGFNYKYGSFDSELDLGLGTDLPEWLPPLKTNIKIASAGLLVEYDSRNTTFTPDHGINARTELQFFEQALGSDRDFFKAYANLRGWIPVRRDVVLGLRADGNASDGDTPFFMLPSVDLRGISLSRYQGQFTLTTEAEMRWDFTRRWSLLGFLGAGWSAATDLNDFVLSDAHPAGGSGFRYLISRVFGIRTGMDFAWSEDDFAFYLVTGTAWGRK